MLSNGADDLKVNERKWMYVLCMQKKRDNVNVTVTDGVPKMKDHTIKEPDKTKEQKWW